MFSIPIRGIDKKLVAVTILLAVVIFGFVIRFVIADQDLVLDDVYSVYYAQLSLGEILSTTASEVAAVPFFYVLLHFWIKIFNNGELAVRMLTILFGLGAVVMMYFAGKAMFNKTVGLWGSLLLSVSSLHVALAIEVRVYTLVVLLALLSMYFFWRYVQTNRQPFLWVYVFFNILLAYSHWQGWFLIAAQFLFVLFYFKKYHLVISKWLLGQVVIALSFIPWIVYSLIPNLSDQNFLTSWIHYARYGYSWFMLFDLPLNFLILVRYVQDNLFAFGIAWYGLFVLLLILAFYNFSRSSRRLLSLIKDKAAERTFLLLIVIISLIGFLIFLIPVPKYYVVASIPLLLLAAYGISTIKLKKYLKLLLIIIILASTFVFLPQMILAGNRFQFEKSIKYIEDRERKNDVIIVHHFRSRLFFDYYYNGDNEVIGLYPKDDYRSLDIEIAKYNALLMTFLNEENIEILSDMTDSYKRVWYLDTAGGFNNVFRADLPHQWFSDNSWLLIEQTKLPYGTVYLYEKT